MSNNNTKKSVNVERRTWDVATYEQKALARQQQQQQQQLDPSPDDPNHHTVNTATANTLKEEFIPAPIGALGPEGSQRAYLQARKRKVADFIDERVGSATLIALDDAVGTKKQSLDIIGGVDTDTIKITDGVTTKKSSSGSSGGVGFHCNVCDCYLKDSLTYLDHVNGRKHQRKLGYTMRVERSTESDVLTKLNELKQVKQQRQQHGTNAFDTNTVDYDKIVKDKDIDEERRREERQRLRKERRKRQNSSEVDNPIVKEVTEAVKDIEDNHNNNHDEVADNDNDEEEEDEEPEAMIDPAMAAMMGFTGFGGT